jgi:hypothetical protein
MPHRISLYANDVVLFVSPAENEIATVKLLLLAFWAAAGLHANFSKSSVTAIQSPPFTTVRHAVTVTPALIHMGGTPLDWTSPHEPLCLLS